MLQDGETLPVADGLVSSSAVKQPSECVPTHLLRSFPETAKALIHLVRSIGEWKAGSVTWMLADVAVHETEFVCFFLGAFSELE